MRGWSRLVRRAVLEMCGVLEEALHAAPMVSNRMFVDGGRQMVNQERLDGLQNQVQILSEQVARLKHENQLLREQQEKSEWLAAEFRQIMLDRLRHSEGH